MPLDRSEIVVQALALLDEHGLDALSMRSLGTRLGVSAPALYWHVGGRAELVSLMARTFYQQGSLAAEQGADWRAWLIGYGRGFRAALLAHRDSARLCASAAPEPDDAQHAADALAAPLVDRGLDRAVALSRLASVISLALGWAIYQQSNALHDHLAAIIGFDESFQSGLAAMVGGFADPQ